MIDRSQIHEGMTVFSVDGHKLGKVITCDVSTFIIEKGFFFPKDFVVRFEDVLDVAGDDIRLSRERDALGEAGDEKRAGTFTEGSSVFGPGGGFETAPPETEPPELGLGSGKRESGRSAWESSTAGRRPPDVPSEQAPRHLESDEDVRVNTQLGEDAGDLGPIRREPEE